MHSLASQAESIVVDAIRQELDLPASESIDPVLRRSDRADFQANFAMAMARSAGVAPRDLAQGVAKRLAEQPFFRDVEVAGPGFINLDVSDAALVTTLDELLDDPALGVVPPARRRRVVVDYSAPNIAKEMHVGHLRSTIIGDVIVRTLRRGGHDVVSQNHLGDWGTPLGMLIEHLAETTEPGSVPDFDDLTEQYQQARARFDAEESFRERSRRRVVDLQAGDPDTLAIWTSFVESSLGYMDDIYRMLGVGLERDDVYGESRYNAALDGVADELEAKGLAVIDDGALCVFPAGYQSKEGTPLPLIIRNSQGGFGYAATDLAAIRYRIEVLGADRLVYVVGTPQSQHLAMVFDVARLAGWVPEGVELVHAAFGSILGPDGKPFRTRAGVSIQLIALLDEAAERALQLVVDRHEDALDEDERRVLGVGLGIAAIKYSDLANDRRKDYVFDWDRMLATVGNTGPYLQYSHARACSILSRAADAGLALDGTDADEATDDAVEPTDHERALLLELGEGQGDLVVEVVESLEPHRICRALYELAVAFNRFYETSPVLTCEDEAVRRLRLRLTDAVRRSLREGLDTLGIDALERV